MRPLPPGMKVIITNEAGHPVGMGHHNTKLTDHEVDLIHELRETGMSLQQIAVKFNVKKPCIWKILHGYTRCQTVTEVTVVPVDGRRRTAREREPDRPKAMPGAADAGLELQQALSSWR